jgi:protein-S-isoprenylcysteine O-methyltransferase Ste14
MTNTTQGPALRRSLISFVIIVAVFAAILFGLAGKFEWPRAWLFLAVFAVAMLVSIMVLWRLNPEIFAARARVQAGTKSWDYVFILLTVGGIAAILPVAALDFRFGWSQLPDWTTTVGCVLFVAGFAGQTWAQAVNRHFEPGVRIQEDRGQTVIDTGPYAIVRHPGYITAVPFSLGIALLLGSGWALVPAAVAVAALAVRTPFEERTLRAELPGYADYTSRVRFRWVPGIW